MTDTGIVRRVDDLGRIVIPMELRRTLGIKVHDPLSISVENERIVLAKHHDACAICGAETDDKQTLRVRDRAVCTECVGLVKGL